MSALKRFWHNESGASAIEYGLIAFCIAIAIVLAVTSIGSTTNNTFETVNGALN